MKRKQGSPRFTRGARRSECLHETDSRVRGTARGSPPSTISHSVRRRSVGCSRRHLAARGRARNKQRDFVGTPAGPYALNRGERSSSRPSCGPRSLPHVPPMDRGPRCVCVAFSQAFISVVCRSSLAQSGTGKAMTHEINGFVIMSRFALKAVEVPKTQERPISLLSFLQAENFRLRQTVVELSIATLLIREEALKRGG